MTSINRFAGYGIAVAAALAAALALLVSTAYADVDTLAAGATSLATGDSTTLTANVDGLVVGDETVTFRVQTSSTGAAVLGAARAQQVACVVDVTDSGAGGLNVTDADCNDAEAAVDLGGAAGDDVNLTITLDTTEEGRIDVIAFHDGVASPTINITAFGEAAAEPEAFEIAAPASVQAGDEFTIVVTVVDDDGDEVNGVTVNVTVDGADADDDSLVSGAGTEEDGEATFTFEADDDADGVVVTFYTGTASVLTDIVETVAIAVGGDAETITVEAPATVAAGGTATVTATVLDEDEDPVPGASINLIASAGSLVACDDNTSSAGVASCTFVAPTSAQTVQITVVSAGAVGTATISVGGAVTPGAPGFTGAISPGVSLVVFNGGTVAELAASAQAAGALSVSTTVGGEFIIYIVGAPAFVNAEFNAAWSTGVPAQTPVILFVPAS